MQDSIKEDGFGNLSVYLVPPKSPRLESLILGWFAAIQRYCTWGRYDAPYWWNERANVSLLAGAAWLSGAAALEEYHTEKEFEHGYSTGRTDLYIKWADRKECVIEAKHCWFNDRSLKRKMNEAMQAARQNHDCETAFACTFVVPSRPLNSKVTPMEMIAAIHREAEPMDIFAASFPRLFRNLQSERDSKIYPGVALVMHRVRP
jgi:hypothetical protein